MAEILLSLTIIGVVAAITLPSLTGNINERTWNTQRKALFARMSQAVSLLDGMRGYGTVNLTYKPQNFYDWAQYSVGDATEVFLSSGLSKVMKLNNICDADHIQDCGMPNEIVDFVGSKVYLTSINKLADFNEYFSGNAVCGGAFYVDGNAAAFETANGESVLAFYNPVCKDFWSSVNIDNGYTVTPTVIMCANFLYDLNGKKGPNTIGKDVGFMTVFYPNDSVVVAPVPMAKNATSATSAQAPKVCSNQGEEYRLPNKEEMASITLNKKFVGNVSGSFATTSRVEDKVQTAYSTGNYWFLGSDGWYIGREYSQAVVHSVRCIKRF